MRCSRSTQGAICSPTNPKEREQFRRLQAAINNYFRILGTGAKILPDGVIGPNTTEWLGRTRFQSLFSPSMPDVVAEVVGETKTRRFKGSALKRAIDLATLDSEASSPAVAKLAPSLAALLHATNRIIEVKLKSGIVEPAKEIPQKIIVAR